MNNNARLQVLLVELEFPIWRQARHWSYATQLGIEEGLHANGVDCLTITTPWFPRTREICARRQFDQVWIEAVHNDLDDTFWQWVASLAPVRIGLVGESLNFRPEELALVPSFSERLPRVESRLKYLTHVLTSDEKDADDINIRRLAKAMWCPAAVPDQFIRDRPGSVPGNRALFSGSLYYERADWVEHPELKGLLVHQSSPDNATVYPALFDALHVNVGRFLRRSWLPGHKSALLVYLCLLRHIRRRCFALWLGGLQNGCAVVNLPHFVKFYSGRVVEGMAAGRPVISWEVPDRPRNRALFEDDREILLYPKDDPSQLAAHIQRILRDPNFGQQIAANAQRKLRRFHTVEKRVQQILAWVATGEAPDYV